MLLTQNGKALAEIQLVASATPVEQHAAEELREHLRRISGATLDIRRISRSPGASPASGAGATPRILIGRNPETEQLLPGFDWTRLQEDGCLVKTVGPSLILAGATPRAALYAVYEFLDRVLDCRWLTPACSVIPERKTIDSGDLDLVHVPVFRYREPHFTCCRDADWAARNRVNGSFFPLTAAHGGKWSYAGGGFAHTFYALVPPTKYFAAHPEFFSELNGRRTYLDGQLCLTNERLVDVVCDNLRGWMRQEPDARILSVTQNDWNGWCRCARCRALDEAEGSPSGTMVHFINAVAERLEAEYPQVLFDTFAYTYSVRPPKTLRPRRNVVIRLCNITPCCDAHPLERCEQNRCFLETLQGWRAIAPQLFIWDYFNNFHHYFQPFPNLDAIAADIPLYARSGVIGIFCQGDGAPTKGCGDMAELRAWLFSRLLWNHTLDVWKLTDEFVRLYYGPAAEFVREYLELLHQPARRGDVHFHLFTPFESPVVAGDMIARCHALFDRAEAAVAADPVLRDRVQAARLPVEYITWRRELRYAVHGARYQPAVPGMVDRLRRFFAVAAAHGVGGLREGGSALDPLQSLAKGYDVLTLRQGRWQADVVPALGGRLLHLRNAESGLDWMHTGHPDQIDYPCAAGYEEYSEHRWRTPGWNEDYQVERQTAAELQLSAPLINGLTLCRVYRLVDNAARGVLEIASTIRNTTEQRREACFRSMPEFAGGDLDHLVVRFRQADGCWRAATPWQTATEPTGSTYLQQVDKPQGAVALCRSEGRLQVDFEAAQIDKVLFDWDRALQVIRIGLNTPGTVLEPGGEFTVRQKWTMGPAE